MPRIPLPVWSALLLHAMLSVALGWPGMTASEPRSAPLYTFCFPNELDVGFGALRFGAEPPQFAGRAAGLRFRICGQVPDPGGGVIVYGVSRGQRDGVHVPQVWRARTLDGFHFEDAEMLFEIPDPGRRVTWAANDVALRGGTLFLLQTHIGSPPTAGHPFYAFAGPLDGGPWRQLREEPVYLGQDAFGLVWNPERNLFVNYQTSYQPWDKRYADNMPNVRRVLHIRTSPDLLNWTPGGSFGVDGPHLPDEQFIVPDDGDPPGTEFYHFRPIRLDGFWAGAMVLYASQPKEVPLAMGAFRVHGPFLGAEWWVSRDGFEWHRPFRMRSGFEGLPHAFPYNLAQPFEAGDELRWAAAGGNLYTQNRRRMFYVHSRAPAEITTPPLPLSGGPLELEIAFDSLLRGEQGMMRQGYLMAELLDETGAVIPGFHRDLCLFVPAGENARERVVLQWGEHRLPPEAAGRNVRLRLAFRDVRIYSLSH